MRIGGIIIPLLKDCTKYRYNRIILQEEVIIPGESEMNVTRKEVCSNFSSTNQGVLATQSKECKPEIHVASSLIPNKSVNIPTRIININKDKKRLERGGSEDTTESEVDYIPNLSRISMAPTKASYACKECGKMTVGSGAHHQHQRRCTKKRVKAASTMGNVVTAEVVDQEVRSPEVTQEKGNGGNISVHFCSNPLTVEDSFVRQSISSVQPPDTHQMESFSINMVNVTNMTETSLNPVVYFDPRDTNFQQIQTDGATIVDINCKVAADTVFRHVPFMDNYGVDTMVEKLVQNEESVEDFLIKGIAAGDTPLHDEVMPYASGMTVDESSVKVVQTTHPMDETDNLMKRIQSIMDDGLTMGGVVRTEEPDVQMEALNESKDGKSVDEPALKVKEAKRKTKKNFGEPSEIAGMDIRTKKSAEKLASKLVEIIRGLPADTRPEDIFDGVKDQFQDTGTHLYPIICGIVTSLNHPRNELDLDILERRAESRENIEINEKERLNQTEKKTMESEVFDDAEESDGDWVVMDDSEDSKEEEDSDDFDLEADVGITLE